MAQENPDDRPEYANPAFDDRRWQAVRLPWARPESPTALEEVYWLRRTIELPPDAGRSGLVLTIGPVREVYELHVNGVRIGATGPFFDNARGPNRTSPHFSVERIANWKRTAALDRPPDPRRPFRIAVGSDQRRLLSALRRRARALV
jgi:hypothetical protein